MKVCALIMTYNRKSKLEECLKALEHQTYNDFDIIVCDNDSTDDTFEYINNHSNDRLKYINAKANNREGSFRYGIEFAYGSEYDWIWVLHDDTLPQPSALEELLSHTESINLVSFFTSAVYSKNNNALNTPPISNFETDGYKFWYSHLDKGMVRVASSSFVSTLINREAISQCGLPLKEDRFGDNSNYLSKLVGNYAAGYMVGKSKVLHCKNVKRAPTYKICAVVVTYNRKETLAECLQALNAQSYKNFDILIIDNASTDGTYDFIKESIGGRIKYFNTGSNLGGAGGFYYGMKMAYQQNYDWFWIMDDDVIPTTSALNELVKPLQYLKTVSFLASAVYSKNGTAMNTPEISRFSTNGYKYWYEFLDRGLIRLSHATFVSLLINRNAVKVCGLPCKDYFIWGDDTEYTMRIIGRFGAAYMVGNSKVIHARAASSALNIRAEKNPQRIGMFYYMIRNTLLNSRTYWGKKDYQNWLKRYFSDCIKIAIGQGSYKKLKIATIVRAIRDYKKGNYDKRAFINRDRLYGQEKAVLSYFGRDYLSSAVSNVKGCTVNNKGKDFSIFTAFEKYSTRFKWESVDNKVALPIKDEIYKYSFLRFNNTLDPNEFFVFDFIGSCNKIANYENDEESIKVNYTDEFAQQEDTAPLKSLQVFRRNFIQPSDFAQDELKAYVLKFAFYINEIFMADKVIMVKSHLYNYLLKEGKRDEIGEEVTKKNALDNEFLDTLYSEYQRRVPECHIIEDLDFRVYQYGSDELRPVDEYADYVRDCIEVIVSNNNRATEKQLLTDIRNKYNQLIQSKYEIE